MEIGDVRDAGNLFRVTRVAQAPVKEMEGHISVEMSHEPLGVVSGALNVSEPRWPTVDKQAFAALKTTST